MNKFRLANRIAHDQRQREEKKLAEFNKQKRIDEHWRKYEARRKANIAREGVRGVDYDQYPQG